MLFWKKKKEPQIALKNEVVVPQEFNTFGLQDLLHYIKREIGVDLLSKTVLLKPNSASFANAKRFTAFANFLKHSNMTKCLDKISLT